MVFILQYRPALNGIMKYYGWVVNQVICRAHFVSKAGSISSLQLQIINLPYWSKFLKYSFLKYKFLIAWKRVRPNPSGDWVESHGSRARPEVGVFKKCWVLLRSSWWILVLFTLWLKLLKGYRPFVPLMSEFELLLH